MVTSPQYYLGTSGWSYPTGFGRWKGVFYPDRWRGDELAYYAERFPAVEVNTSFYRLPAAETVRTWVQRTPPAFRFAVKLFRKFTHPDFYAREEGRSPEITPQDIHGMRATLDALAEQGRLGALLVQYPDFFHKTPQNLSALVRTLDTFHAYPLAVELRHASWEDAQTRDALAHFSAARVRIDEPFYQNLDDEDVPGASFGYWRFHGRNAEEWRKPGSGHHRYDYYYSSGELVDLVEAITRKTGDRRGSFIFFNNHVSGQALANAIALAAKLDIPLPYGKCANLAGRFPDLRAITGEVGGQLRILDE